jgi:hypothetical protein
MALQLAFAVLGDDEFVACGIQVCSGPMRGSPELDEGR